MISEQIQIIIVQYKRAVIISIKILEFNPFSLAILVSN